MDGQENPISLIIPYKLWAVLLGSVSNIIDSLAVAAAVRTQGRFLSVSCAAAKNSPLVTHRTDEDTREDLD
jgi:hypothetical protein